VLGLRPRRPAIKAEPSDQQKLLTLQGIDTEIATLNRRKLHLPEKARITALLTDRKRLLEDFTEAETRVADLERAQAKAEADLEPVRARKVRNQERVDAGAADPKALTGLISEIEHLTRRIGVLEDAQLELMEEAEQASARFAAIKARRIEMEDTIRSLMVVRDSELAALDSQLQHAAAKRETVVEKMPPALVKHYERIRDRRDGVGVAELVERRCEGCRLDLNSAEVSAFASAAPDELLSCEECGRILIRTSRSGLPA
jgi:predicted  nucleic acid-binding Zn-ribbon protein